MGGPRSNIETVARAICAREHARPRPAGPGFDSDVERFWPVVAAQLEAGLIDGEGRRRAPPDHDRELDAYRDWRSRHPDHAVPPRDRGP